MECRLCRVRFPGVQEIRVAAPSPEGVEHKAAWMAWTYGWKRIGDEWQCGIHRGVDPKAKFVVGKCKAIGRFGV